MSILTEKLQNTVMIDNAEVPINTDFRISVQFEMLIQSDIPDNEKIEKSLTLYYPRIPRNIEKAVEKIIEFYSGNAEKSDGKAKSAGKNSRPVYSFRYDADYMRSVTALSSLSRHRLKGERESPSEPLSLAERGINYPTKKQALRNGL